MSAWETGLLIYLFIYKPVVVVVADVYSLRNLSDAAQLIAF